MILDFFIFVMNLDMKYVKKIILFISNISNIPFIHFLFELINTHFFRFQYTLLFLFLFCNCYSFLRKLSSQDFMLQTWHHRHLLIWYSTNSHTSDILAFVCWRAFLLVSHSEILVSFSYYADVEILYEFYYPSAYFLIFLPIEIIVIRLAVRFTFTITITFFHFLFLYLRESWLQYWRSEILKSAAKIVSNFDRIFLVFLWSAWFTWRQPHLRTIWV